LAIRRRARPATGELRELARAAVLRGRLAAGHRRGLRPAVLGNGYARSARIVAVFTTVGVILGIVMSVVQAIWILVAAVAVARSAPSVAAVAPALS
jgi:hypothetical protein